MSEGSQAKLMEWRNEYEAQASSAGSRLDQVFFPFMFLAYLLGALYYVCFRLG